MASIQKRELQDGSIRWLAQVRKKGYKTVNITKLTKKSAENAARKVELAMDNNTWDEFTQEEKKHGDVTLKYFIQRYLKEITPNKLGGKVTVTNETATLNLVLKSPLAKMDVYRIKTGDIKELASKWKADGNVPSTIIRKLTTLQHVFTAIKSTWKHETLNNPVRGAKPSLKQKRSGKTIAPTRSRTLSKLELSNIRTALNQCRSPYIRCIFEFALETALRRREILENTWGNVKYKEGYIFIPAEIAKTREEREVPLTPRALEILKEVHNHQSQYEKSTDEIFPITTKAFAEAWKRVIKRSKVKGFQFRDSRHIAITMLSNAYPKMQDLARTTGHERLETLLIYYEDPIEKRVERLHSFCKEKPENDAFSLSSFS